MGAKHRTSKLEDQYPNHFASDANTGETQPSKKKSGNNKKLIIIMLTFVLAVKSKQMAKSPLPFHLFASLAGDNHT